MEIKICDKLSTYHEGTYILYVKDAVTLSMRYFLPDEIDYIVVSTAIADSDDPTQLNYLPVEGSDSFYVNSNPTCGQEKLQGCSTGYLYYPPNPLYRWWKIEMRVGNGGFVKFMENYLLNVDQLGRLNKQVLPRT